MNPIDMNGIRVILASGCQDPECKINHPKEGLILSPRCHPGAPVFALATPEGVLMLSCAVCKYGVAGIQIAEGEHVGDA